MRKVIASVIAVTSAVTVGGSTESAKTQELQRSAPKTQLEAFTGETGVVIIRGHTEIGSVSGTGRVRVSAISFRNAKTGQEKTGIIVEVKGGGSYSREGRSLVDYEEISGLVDGISYVSKVQRSDTKLRDFEATYSTKGDLKITVFNDASGKTNAAIQIGNIASESAFISMENLAQFARLVVQAKDVLDRPESLVGVKPISSPQPATSAPARIVPPQPQPKQLPPAKRQEPGASNVECLKPDGMPEPCASRRVQ